jgi:hypothetical protein
VFLLRQLFAIFSAEYKGDGPMDIDNGPGRIGEVSMIKEGDKFKDGKSGKVFTVKKIHSDRIMLEAEDGSFQNVLIPESMPLSGQNDKRKKKRP